MSELQKNQIFKPIKKLTNKHLFPNNLERQNFGRAMAIFTHDMISAFECYAKNKTKGFKNAGATIYSMKKIIKWIEMHNISNIN